MVLIDRFIHYIVYDPTYKVVLDLALVSRKDFKGDGQEIKS